MEYIDLQIQIFKYIQKSEMEHWSVRSIYFLGGKCNQGREGSFSLLYPTPIHPLFLLKQKQKEYLPFLFCFF